VSDRKMPLRLTRPGDADRRTTAFVTDASDPPNLPSRKHSPLTSIMIRGLPDVGLI
jgi:hypothetical protein